MSAHVPMSLRRLVADRAERICEYCLIHEVDTFYGCQIEHIIAQKHGGATTAENLAYACVFCNRYKGSDVASVLGPTGEIVRLFHPRTDRWASHFTLDLESMLIRPITEIGEVTTALLNLNDPDRVIERRSLAAAGRFPSQPARRRIHDDTRAIDQ